MPDDNRSNNDSIIPRPEQSPARHGETGLSTRPSQEIATRRDRPADHIDPAKEYEAISDELAAMTKSSSSSRSSLEAPSAVSRQVGAYVRDSPFVRGVLSLMLLGFGLGGFLILSTQEAILWLVFLLVAFPVGLAFLTSADKLQREDLITIYKEGVRQIPAIGKLLSLSPEAKKKD